MKLIKVLIVDDSKLVREILKEILASYPLICIVGEASDAFDARDKIKLLNPDVITLDVEMPKMDGVTFLKNLMRLRPMPVIMLSTLTTKGADITLQALEAGAVDFITKPKSSTLMGNLSAFNNALYNKILLASKVNVDTLKRTNNDEFIPSLELSSKANEHHIIALGASTGGTEALREILRAMPVDCPPIIATQHIPKTFSGRFAKRLDDICKMKVHEARQGQALEKGHIYIAPGDLHLTIKYVNGRYLCQLEDSSPVNRHKPSVDVMFASLLKLESATIHAGLLTGMGGDGAKELLQLKAQGHFTLVQDKATSMVWGMPRVAYNLNAHCKDVPLNQVAKVLLNSVDNGLLQKRKVRMNDVHV